MNRILRLNIACVVVVLLASALLAVSQAAAQPAPASPSPKPTNGHANVKANGCDACHTCAAPTREAPCLKECARPREKEFLQAISEHEQPPKMILLDMLSTERDQPDNKDHFGPVPFDHAGHAKWAELAGGCTLCHHYSPESGKHPACRTCHEVAFKHDNMRKPGLKGAYHRQCLNCHREWSHETRCGVCHLARIGDEAGGVDPDAITKDDSFGQMHPPIPEPEIERYQTKGRSDSRKYVFFHHKRHTENYELKCAECHMGDSCSRCHEYGKTHVQKVRSLDEHHRPCAACHDVDDAEKCRHCHVESQKEEPALFAHASTGWPLSRYHESVSCRDCHIEAPYRRKSRVCTDCHEDWAPDTFDHKVTGQVLDENHIDADCTDCHLEGNYEVTPKCGECHEVDEGFALPLKRPGPQAAP